MVNPIIFITNERIFSRAVAPRDGATALSRCVISIGGLPHTLRHVGRHRGGASSLDRHTTW
ncbi:Hypothetical predicted protein, partial [Olea europaea subsp. europaea]